MLHEGGKGRRIGKMVRRCEKRHKKLRPSSAREIKAGEDLKQGAAEGSKRFRV